MTEVVFYIFATIAVLSAALCILQRSPMVSALWLISTMFSLAAIYVLLNAQFIAAIQVLVYAGAIMVVFLFVVMLLNLGHADEIADIKGKGARIAAGAVGLAFLAQLFALGRQRLPEQTLPPVPREDVIGAVASPLFREYLLPFEITSVLLLAAIIGAVLLAKRRI